MRAALLVLAVIVISALSGLGAVPPPATPQPQGPAGPWTMTFDDEFNGTSLDRTKWSPCWFYPTCATQSNVKTDPTLVTVANGVATLKLTSATTGAAMSTNPQGGASPGFQFQYGAVEARISFPGDGTHCLNWPGWWTDGQSWPTNGEYDIAEVAQSTGLMTVNYHSSSGTHNQGSVPGFWCGGYHVYTLDREAGHSYVYFDGTLVKDYATDDARALQYLIVNISSTSGPYASYPAQVQVDYVRAWRHGNSSRSERQTAVADALEVVGAYNADSNSTKAHLVWVHKATPGIWRFLAKVNGEKRYGCGQINVKQFWHGQGTNFRGYGPIDVRVCRAS